MILTIHGVNEKNPAYAQHLVDNIGLPVKQLFWGDVVTPYENFFNSTLQSCDQYHKTAFKDLRPIVNVFVGVAVAWFDDYIREEIQNKIEAQILNLPEEPHTWVLHSWGNIVLFDTLMRNENKTISKAFYQPGTKIVTFGNPIAYYLITGAKQPVLADILYDWINFFHPLDLIGSPISSFTHAKDVEVTDVGPPNCLRSDVSLIFAKQAHECYWKSKQIADLIKEKNSAL